MIAFTRISAVIARHVIPTFRDPIRITDMLYYPLIDLILFGFLAIWAHTASTPHSQQFIVVFLTCVACWYLVYRPALEISRNVLIEIWENHLVNLLAGPLSLVEFMLALMAIGLLQALITFVYSSGVIWFIFGVNIFKLYPLIMPYIPFFIVFGWTIGLITAAFIFYFGKSVEFITWAFPWFFALLSGAYYSLDLFPLWAQKVAALFPAGYLFSGVRAVLSGQPHIPKLIMGSLLALFYLALAFLFLLYTFYKSKERGLSNLD